MFPTGITINNNEKNVINPPTKTVNPAPAKIVNTSTTIAARHNRSPSRSVRSPTAKKCTNPNPIMAKQPTNSSERDPGDDPKIAAYNAPNPR